MDICRERSGGPALDPRKTRRVAGSHRWRRASPGGTAVFTLASVCTGVGGSRLAVVASEASRRRAAVVAPFDGNAADGATKRSGHKRPPGSV